jgi:hypothetical protein
MDIAGTYAAMSARAAVAGGGSATSMKNSKGVVISLSAVVEGLNFAFAPRGATISFIWNTFLSGLDQRSSNNREGDAGMRSMCRVTPIGHSTLRYSRGVQTLETHAHGFRPILCNARIDGEAGQIWIIKTLHPIGPLVRLVLNARYLSLRCCPEPAQPQAASETRACF